jgi:hypothetical protein
MLHEEGGSGLRAESFDPPGTDVQLDAQRRRVSLLGDVREAIFGAHDGLVSTLAVVTTMSGATNDRYPVLVPGVGAGLAGSSE